MPNGAPKNIFVENIPGYGDARERVINIAKGDKKEILRTGREVLMAQTAGAMIANAPTAIASGSLGALLTNTIAQPLIMANPTALLIGGGAALTVGGVAYLANKRIKYVNRMFREGKDWDDILESDIKSVASLPVQLTTRTVFGGLNLGVSAINQIMIEGGTLDKTLDKVIKRGEGTYKGEFLPAVDQALNFVERITNFNPALAFIPPRERQKATDKGKDEKDKKAA